MEPTPTAQEEDTQPKKSDTMSMKGPRLSMMTFAPDHQRIVNILTGKEPVDDPTDPRFLVLGKRPSGTSA